MGRIEIDGQKCKGCGLCISVCPKKNIKLSSQINDNSYYYAVFEDPEEECTGCANCATICPDIVIKVYR